MSDLVFMFFLCVSLLLFFSVFWGGFFSGNLKQTYNVIVENLINKFALGFLSPFLCNYDCVLGILYSILCVLNMKFTIIDVS